MNSLNIKRELCKLVSEWTTIMGMSIFFFRGSFAIFQILCVSQVKNFGKMKRGTRRHFTNFKMAITFEPLVRFEWNNLHCFYFFFLFKMRSYGIGFGWLFFLPFETLLKLCYLGVLPSIFEKKMFCNSWSRIQGVFTNKIMNLQKECRLTKH